MIGKIISHYKILEKLGEGGMGVVYKAQDVQLQRLVALKFLPPHVAHDPEEKARFIHEAQAASALNHPNICTIYGIEDPPEGLFIAMEYIEGKTIEKLMGMEPPSIKKILDIAIQGCEGLAAAHKKEIIHRDIKSENIMITNEGLVKIMDFGIAKLKGATKLTSSDSTLGTAAFMSPEQAAGEEVDQRSDIFSFGVVLYQLLTGHLPFKGEHQAAIVYSILNETPEPLARYKSNIPEGLQRIVEKALEKDKDERYQHIDDMMADLRKERKSLDYTKTTQIPRTEILPKSKKKLLRFYVPASVLFVLILLVLILKPFKLEVVSEKKASAEENTLAIMYFENMADREDHDSLGEIVTNLLITDFSESQYLNVVSSQRLYDILKLLGKEGTKTIDKNVASEVANKAGAKWMLLGSILQVEPQIIVTSQLVEVKTGGILSSQRINGEPNEKIFSIVDKLTVELKKGLSLPVQAKSEQARSVADVTTHSQEAYRYYLEGLDLYNKLYGADAEKSFQKALEIDSTFAMAYYWLAIVSTGEKRNLLVAKAVRYSDKVSQKEKDYIQCLEALVSGNQTQEIKILERIIQHYPDEKQAYFMLASIYQLELKEFEPAVTYLNKAIAIDPLYKLAYNMLAYSYNEIGDFEKSIWAINQYISLAPGEANPYDSRGDLYAYNGKLDQAIDSYQKALEIKPDFYASLIKLGCAYIFKGEIAKADSCFKVLSSCDSKDIRSNGRTLLSLVPLYQGKFTDALQVLDDGIAADRMEQAGGETIISKHELKALIYDDRNQSDLALQEIETTRSIYEKIMPGDPVGMRDVYAVFLARNGKFKEAGAVLQALKENAEGKSKTGMDNYWLALGIIDLIKGDAAEAVKNLEKGVKDAPTVQFDARYFLAQAYLASGKIGEAVTELEKALLRYDDNRAVHAIWSVKAYYLVAMAYEKSGWNNKAIESYERFLDIWKNADPGIKEVADAKERLNKLRANL